MRILVLGVGNILLTDEAIGVRIVEALEQRYVLPDFVDVLDGGTAGMELLGDMANRDHLIIADAIVSKKNTPGTMMVLRDEEIPALFTNKISPHQLGLADVLSALRFTGEFPKKLTLVGIIPESLERISELRNLLNEKGLTTDIEVDGGIYHKNVAEVLAAGANVMVSGSGVFKGDIKDNTAKFMEILNGNV